MLSISCNDLDEEVRKEVGAWSKALQWVIPPPASG